MAKYYYIDSESVGDSWIKLLNNPENIGSKLRVFYTENSPRIAYPQAVRLMNSTNKPQFIECYKENNRLDFQLVSYMECELLENNTNEVIIVSNNTRFDTVVLFWNESGMNVKRVSGPELLTTCTEETEDILVDVNIIINCIGKGNLPIFYLVCTHLYGNQRGMDIYIGV